MRRLQVKKFVKRHVRPNTLIRLWYPSEKGGHIMVEDHVNRCYMSHQLEKNKYANCRVMGVTDIVVRQTAHSEAVNLVIEKPIK